MLNTRIEARTFKNQVYADVAIVAKALGSARRLELVDLLVQGPRSVEALATATEQPIGSASQHLQVLKRSRVVHTTRLGTTIEYRLAPGVADAFVIIRRLAEARSPDLATRKAAFYTSRASSECIDRHTLRERLAAGTAVLLDVRPADEFRESHLDGATSLPIAELDARIDELPSDQLIVAMCRGPFCVFAADAVRKLTASGRHATRFEDGVGEWKFDGGAVVGTAR